jgi:hypothetical protein
MNIEQVAKICHELNRLFCESIGDQSQKPWDEAEQWQRDSAVAGVKFKLANPLAPSSAQHDAWTKDKLDSGWRWGPVKDAIKKEHPCLVDYHCLPDEQKAKDKLFIGVVDALRNLIK